MVLRVQPMPHTLLQMSKGFNTDGQQANNQRILFKAVHILIA